MQTLMNTLRETESVWNLLQRAEAPIVIYGMGDGAIKIMSVLESFGIKPAAIFASDEFVRGHNFQGYKVHTLAEVEAMYEEFIIVLAFAAGYPSLVEKLCALNQRHTLLAPDVPVAGEGLFTPAYLHAHIDEAEEVYAMLADEQSRRTYADILDFKLSGKIRYLMDCTTEREEVYARLLKPSKKETFVDLGAYDGDTIEEFLAATGGECNRIIAVEPDAKNFAKLQKRLQEDSRVSLHHAGAWSSDTILPFQVKAGRNSAVGNGVKVREVQMRTVDSLLQGEPATIIKLDVEGAEAQAIQGSALTITQHRPKLLLSLYHRNEDMFALPLQIKRLNPAYSLYVRHHLYIPAWETNLYCI